MSSLTIPPTSHAINASTIFHEAVQALPDCNRHEQGGDNCDLISLANLELAAAPKENSEIKRMSSTKQYDAALLCLEEIQSQAVKQKDHAMRLFHTAGDKLQTTSFQTIDIFIDTMNWRDGGVKSEGDVNAKYLEFYNDFNELLIKIQTMLGIKKDAHYIGEKGAQIIDEIMGFMRTHVDTTIGGPYKTLAEADALVKQFKQGTVEVAEGDDGEYRLKPSYSALDELVPALCDDSRVDHGPDGVDTQKMLRDFFHEWKKSPPASAADFWNNWNLPLLPFLKGYLVTERSPSQIQAAQLALDDIRKVHETETQFSLEKYNRDLTQYNNMVKAFSSFMESLMQTLRGFL